MHGPAMREDLMHFIVSPDPVMRTHSWAFWVDHKLRMPQIRAFLLLFGQGADVHLPSQDLLAPFCAACLKLLPEPALRHAPHLSKDPRRGLPAGGKERG